MDYTTKILGYTLEYYDDGHQYLIDGVSVPSISEMLKSKFGGKYDGINRTTLKRAAEAGTEVHEAIERFCKTGAYSALPEVRNFRFLQKQYKFDVFQNEVPVILMVDDEPIAAGRLDMVLKMDGLIGGADIKRVATLDKEYLAYQLNLYRIAYKQCYGVDWQFLRGIHLRNDVRRFVKIPINEYATWQFINDWRKCYEQGMFDRARM